MVFSIVDLSGDDDNVDEVLVDVLGGEMRMDGSVLMPSLSSRTKSKPIGLHDPLVKSTPSCHKSDPTHSSFVKSVMVHMVFSIVDLSGDDDNVDEVLVDVLGGGMVD
nr:hypothetical protein CFP56_26508 [Quercus suber]